jgi:hypothetical protein
MKFRYFISLFLLNFFITGNGFSQQNSLQQMLNSAKAVKKNSPAQNNSQSQQGPPAGHDVSWKVMVNFTRTMTATSDLTSLTTAACKPTKKGTYHLTVSGDFESDKNDGWINEDDFNLGTYGDADNELKHFLHPFKGSFTGNSSGSEVQKNCGDVMTTVTDANGTVDLTGLHLSFLYNKKRKEGSVNLSPQTDYQTNANGKVTYSGKSGSGTVNTTDLAKTEFNMMFGLCSNFSILNFAVAKDAMSQQLLQSSPLNGAMGSIGETKYGYDISYSETRTIDDVPDGWTGTARVTYTTSVHILITNQDPPQYDAIIELVNAPNISSGVNDYSKWIPQGPPPPAKNPGASPLKKGNSICFDVYLVDKKNPEQRLSGIKYDVDFKLTDVSIEPGYCNNYPLNSIDKGKDLKFDESLKNASHAEYDSLELKTKDYYGQNFIAVITSYDYGSFGKLTATVTLEFGSQYQAHFKNDKRTVILLPKDDNNNQVADEWEIEQGIFQKNYSSFWDGEKEDNNDHDGDGLTLYEEYRGMMVKGKHLRLNPNVKDIIIANTTSQKIDGAMSYFSNACKGKIVPVEVKAGDELDNDNPIVNKNSDFAKMGDQYGIVFKIVNNLIGDDGSVVLGQAFVKNNIATGADNGNGLQSHIPGANEPVAGSPKDVKYLALNDTLLNDITLLNYSFAHELGHCLGVQHHGNSKTHSFDNFDRYLFQKQGFSYISEDGTPQNSEQFINNLKNHVPMEAALPGSQAGGDVGCIMCYNQAYEFSFPNDIKGNVLIVCDIRHPNGSYFCTNQKGTDRNDPVTSGKHPYPVFGNATTGGNCTGSILVKDW